MPKSQNWGLFLSIVQGKTGVWYHCIQLSSDWKYFLWVFDFSTSCQIGLALQLERQTFSSYRLLFSLNLWCVKCARILKRKEEEEFGCVFVVTMQKILSKKKTNQKPHPILHSLKEHLVSNILYLRCWGSAVWDRWSRVWCSVTEQPFPLPVSKDFSGLVPKRARLPGFRN